MAQTYGTKMISIAIVFICANSIFAVDTPSYTSNSEQYTEAGMEVDSLGEEPYQGESEVNVSPAMQNKQIKKKLGSKVLTKCPDDMEYIIMDYNPKLVYEVCIDRYEYPNQVGEMPMVGMTWYKAKALCEGKGKYLCWDREWTKACVGLNNWDFSYYNIYDSTKCNVKSEGINKIGDDKECKTRNYDVYDMVGNVREWTGGGGVGASGGTFKDGRSARCSKWEPLTLKRGYDDVGFRCCVRVFTGRYGKVSREALLKGNTNQGTLPYNPDELDSTLAPRP